MRFKQLIGAAGLAFLVTFALPAAAADGIILGLSSEIDELELYKSPTAETASETVTARDMSFPTAILGVSNNGMFKISYKGAEYWVISDDVRSDRSRSVDTACDPKMAGSVVAHGKRGAGEGCQ